MDEIDLYFSEHTWSANTQATYRYALEKLLAELDLQRADVRALRTWLASTNWGSSMCWTALVAAKGFIRWRYGAMHPALLLKIKRVEAPPQRFLTLEQVENMASIFDTTTPKGRRDLAMFGVLLNCALRASEICRLSLPYLDLESQSLRVIVKGGHWNRRVFDTYTANWIAAWLADRERIAAPGVDVVFVGIGGLTPGQQMNRGGLRCVVRNWGKKIGIKLSPHDFRRSMGSIATQLGAPEETAMKGGGWKSHAVFRRYTVGVTAEDLRPYSPTTAAMEGRFGKR